MIKFYSNLLLLGSLLCISCNQTVDTDNYFAEEVHECKDTESIRKVNLDTLEIEGIYKGPVFVYDTLLFYYPLNASATNFYDVYNLKNGSSLGKFCNKGNGPDEAIAITTISHFYKENGDLKTLLYAGNEKKLHEWNISESLKQGRTVFDKIQPYDWEVDKHYTIYNRIFRLDSDSIYAITPAISLTINGQTISAPLYEKRTIRTNELIKSYPVFKDLPQGDGEKLLSPKSLLSSSHSIKPDLSKVVQAHKYIQQINITDLKNGKIDSYRVKGTPGFSIFNTNINKIKYNYLDVTADNNFIYALFSGSKINNPDNKQNSIVYIYNWNGQIVNKIDLGHSVDQIVLDTKDYLLYARKYVSEQIYCCHLNQL